MLKKIPNVNIVLFALMLGIIAAAIVGVIKFVKSSEPYNNFVETTYNADLSKHYTDSLSHTSIARLGHLEISIYDSIENMQKSFVLCQIKNNDQEFSYVEVCKRAIPTLRELFPNETWEGEITYSISGPLSYRSSTTSIHNTRLESLDESIWDD